MNEQQNNPGNFSQGPGGPQKKISSSALINILLGALIIGGALYYFYKLRPAAPVTTMSTVEQKATPQPTATPAVTGNEATLPAAETAEPGTTAPPTTSSIDFDYEANQLDAQANSVNPTDFSDSDATDAAIGL